MYGLLVVQENLFLISIMAEILNVIYYSLSIKGIVPPSFFLVPMGVFNIAYVIYLISILLFVDGNFKTFISAISSLKLVNALFFIVFDSVYSVLNIFNSVICIVILVLAHIPIYFLIDEIEKETKVKL